MKKRVAVPRFLVGLSLIGATFVAPVFVPTVAQAREVACYRIASTNSPDADEVSASNPGSLRQDTWCYESLAQPEGATFIYNADSNLARPELSAIVERDGTLVHASLLEGEITVHRLKSNYNPMPFPLAPPANARRIKEAERGALSGPSLNSLNTLLRSPATNEDISIMSEGDFSAAVRSTVAPWRGYWWPYSSGRLYRGSDSPLAKFDRYVKARIGVNPGAQSWESRNHKPNGLSWAGHCNGWAAASILRREPRSSIRDSRSGVTFSVSDLKGILSEKDKCVKIAFFGKRYDGYPGDDLKDIYAGEFHNTLLYYIGRLQKPVALDELQGKGIENHVISSYRMSTRRISPREMVVHTTVKIHKYDNGRTNEPGKAPFYEKTFKYRLFLDADGQILKSRWITKNPDFLWVPLAPDKCETSNPHVTEDWVERIIDT